MKLYKTISIPVWCDFSIDLILSCKENEYFRIRTFEIIHNLVVLLNFFFIFAKNCIMVSDFYSDEGINFTHEDVLELANWFVPELIKNGCIHKEVIEFYDSITWNSVVTNYLRKREKRCCNKNNL